MSTLSPFPPDVDQIIPHTSRVTFERYEGRPGWWVATAWHQGLPVARRPIEEAALVRLLDGQPYTVRTW